MTSANNSAILLNVGEKNSYGIMLYFVLPVMVSTHKERKTIYMMIVPRRNDFDLLDDMFNDSFFAPHSNEKVMKTDIKEHENSYELISDLPGFDKENINLSIENGYLTINAKTESKNDEEEKGKYVRRERYSGEFSRSFYVGDDVTENDIKASFKNGTLTVSIPKKEVEEKSSKKYIEIDD